MATNTNEKYMDEQDKLSAMRKELEVVLRLWNVIPLSMMSKTQMTVVIPKHGTSISWEYNKALQREFMQFMTFTHFKVKGNAPDWHCGVYGEDRHFVRWTDQKIAGSMRRLRFYSKKFLVQEVSTPAKNLVSMFDNFQFGDYAFIMDSNRE